MNISWSSDRYMYTQEMFWWVEVGQSLVTELKRISTRTSHKFRQGAIFIAVHLLTGRWLATAIIFPCGWRICFKYHPYKVCFKFLFHVNFTQKLVFYPRVKTMFGKSVIITNFTSRHRRPCRQWWQRIEQMAIHCRMWSPIAMLIMALMLHPIGDEVHNWCHWMHLCHLWQWIAICSNFVTTGDDGDMCNSLWHLCPIFNH